MCAGSTSGTLRCVQRSDVGSLSSRRRGDRARSSMPRRAARGAGSRAMRRLEALLCRPLPRRRALNRHPPLRFHPSGAAASLAQFAARRRLHKWNRPTSHAKLSLTHVGRPDSVGLGPPRGAESGCAGRSLRATSFWELGFPQPRSAFRGVRQKHPRSDIGSTVRRITPRSTSGVHNRPRSGFGGRPCK